MWAGRLSVTTWTSSWGDKVHKSLPWRVGKSWKSHWGLRIREAILHGLWHWESSMCSARYWVCFHERLKQETLTLGLDSCCCVCPYLFSWLIMVQQVQSLLLRALGKGRQWIPHCSAQAPGHRQTEVPLVLSTWNFVDLSKFFMGRYFLSSAELDLILSGGGKAIWRALIWKITFSKF